MHQILFQLGLCPRPRSGSFFSAPSDLLAGFKGPTLRGGRGGEGSKREGREIKGREGRGGKGRGGNVEFYHLLKFNYCL